MKLLSLIFFLLLTTNSFAIDGPGKSFLQSSYQITDADDLSSGFHNESHSINLSLAYRKNLFTNIGGALIFNKSEGEKAGTGSNKMNLYAVNTFYSRMVKELLSLSGSLGYFQGDGESRILSAPGVSNDSSINTLVLGAGLNRFFLLTSKFDANAGINISANRKHTSTLTTATYSNSGNTHTTFNSGVNGGVNYSISDHWKAGLSTLVSHVGGRSRRGYLTIQPMTSLLYEGNFLKYGIKGFYGISRGQNLESGFGGISFYTHF